MSRFVVAVKSDAQGPVGVDDLYRDDQPDAGAELRAALTEWGIAMYEWRRTGADSVEEYSRCAKAHYAANERLAKAIERINGENR